MVSTDDAVYINRYTKEAYWGIVLANEEGKTIINERKLFFLSLKVSFNQTD